MYWLHESGGSRAFRGSISLSVEDAFATTRADKRPGRVEVRWAMGAKVPVDMIRATIVAPVIVSDLVVDVLKTREFTGWETYPIELFGHDGIPIHGYQGLAVRGRCGPIDDSRSMKFDKIMPGGVFPWWRGLYFDPATWDGSDLFMPAGNVGWILVVEAVKRAFEKAKVKNGLFTRLDEVERMKL
ncbi:MAG: hypothetical protein IT376_10610 [Polyangiaceae bacterium]|nr:hypothetical protein [Polyangiaceae bacterium]